MVAVMTHTILYVLQKCLQIKGYTNLRISQWDLGEFTGPGRSRSTATRWGTKSELLSAINAAKLHGIDVIVDAVLNVSLSPTQLVLFLIDYPSIKWVGKRRS